MEKNRIPVTIAGTTLTLITDEAPEVVLDLAEQVDARIRGLTGSSLRVSPLDAALLCAVDTLGDKLTAEKRVRSLEAQLSLCEVNMKSLREEITACKKALAEERTRAAEAAAQTPATAETDLSAPLSGDLVSLDEKITALEKYLEGRKSSGSTRSHEERIRYIESLLRGNDDNA